MPECEFIDMLTELDRMGFQTHTHATGDWGIRLALDCDRTRRSGERAPRIVGTESCTSNACIPTTCHGFARWASSPRCSPRHCSPDLVAGTWMENVGEERWDRAWRFRSAR